MKYYKHETCTFDWRETRQWDLKLIAGCGRRLEWLSNIAGQNLKKKSLLSYIFTKPSQHPTISSATEPPRNWSLRVTLPLHYGPSTEQLKVWNGSDSSLYILCGCVHEFSTLWRACFSIIKWIISVERSFRPCLCTLAPQCIQSYLPPLRRTCRPFVVDNSPLLHWTTVLLPEHIQ